MWRIPPCHTSKVVSWHVHWGYELHLWSSLSKVWLKVSKTCDISCFHKYCQYLPLFETFSQILLWEDHKWSLYHQCTCHDTTFDIWQGGNSTKKFPSPEGGLRTIRKTELEENNGILKNPLYTLLKGPKRHNICSILLPNQKSCKNDIPYCNNQLLHSKSGMILTSQIVILNIYASSDLSTLMSKAAADKLFLTRLASN